MRAFIFALWRLSLRNFDYPSNLPAS